MKIKSHIIISLGFFALFSCRQEVEKETTNFEYFDVTESDTISKAMLFAVTDEEFLQYGSNVAYLNIKGDTLIPFGKFGYLGTDTLKYYANTFLQPNNGSTGRWVGIDHQCKILFDLVNFDNGPDYFNDGLTRVTRNGKMGYANKYGQVVIPCQFECAGQFKNGQAKVALYCEYIYDEIDHVETKSDKWFHIDREGNTITTPQQNL